MNTDGHKELAAARWERLRAVLRQHHVLRVEQLCSELDVSAATVRRDLEQLEERGQIRRVHGGAVLVEDRGSEPLFDAKTNIARPEKERIARAALAYIQPGETIYLDGGSTVLELARLLAEHTNLTVVTNSLRAAWELAGRGPQLILIGGELRRLSQTVVGPLTRLVLEQLHLDRAFMGTIGVEPTAGMTTTDPGEAFTKQLVIRQARQVLLLADSSKAGKIAFARAGELADVDVLITDARINASFGRQLQKLGVKLVKA